MSKILIAYKIEENNISGKQDVKFGIITQDPEKFINFWTMNREYILTEEKITE